MEEVVGENLRVVPTDPKPSADEQRELGRGFGSGALGTDYIAHYSHDVGRPLDGWGHSTSLVRPSWRGWRARRVRCICRSVKRWVGS